MSVLIPIVSRKETNHVFLEQAMNKEKEIHVLFIVDKDFGLGASDLMHGQKIIEEIKSFIGKKKKHAETVTEWGNTVQKIINYAKLKKINTVFLADDGTQFIQEVLMALRKEDEFKTEIISVTEE